MSDFDLEFPVAEAWVDDTPPASPMSWEQWMRELTTRLPKNFRVAELPRRCPVPEPFILD